MCHGNEVNVQVRRTLVKVHYSIEHFEVRITLLKFAHIIVKHGFRRIPIHRTKPAVMQISKLHHNLIEQLTLARFLDVFVVVGDFTVGTFLLSVVFRKSRAKHLLIELPQINFYVGNVVARP